MNPDQCTAFHLEPVLRKAITAARNDRAAGKMPDRTSPDGRSIFDSIEKKDIIKMAKFVSELTLLYHDAKKAKVDYKKVTAAGGAATAASTASSIGGLETTSFVLSQLGASLSTSVQIASHTSPIKLTTGALIMLGQKASIAAGFASNSELTRCRAALFGLAASTGATFILGPLGWIPFIALGMTALDTIMVQCEKTPMMEALGF